MSIKKSKTKHRSLYQQLIALIILMGSVALLIGLTADKTAAPIAKQAEAAKQAAIARILPPDSHDNNILENIWMITSPQLGSKNPLPLYRASKNGKISAIVITAIAPHGYNGAIQLLIGIDANGQLAGVRAIAHQETPGLGDKMLPENSDWIYSFDNRSIENPILSQWRVKKDGGIFDSWTGATITPRAIVDAVRNALLFFQSHQRELLDPSATGLNSASP